MTDPELLVQDYLARLERAAARLDADRRAELLASITEHLDEARSTGAAQDEAAVRTLLDRLGEPVDIVAAAQDGGPSGGRQDRVVDPSTPRRGTGLELAAVLMLTAGSFLPVVGWLVGAVLLWCSDRWRAGEKLLGTLVVPLGPGGVVLLGGLLPFSQRAEVCTTSPSAPLGSSQPLGDGSAVTTCSVSGPPEWVGLLLTVLLVLAAVAVPIWLYRTARRRADAQPEAVLSRL